MYYDTVLLLLHIICMCQQCHVYYICTVYMYTVCGHMTYNNVNNMCVHVILYNCTSCGTLTIAKIVWRVHTFYLRRYTCSELYTLYLGMPSKIHIILIYVQYMVHVYDGINQSSFELVFF